MSRFKGVALLNLVHLTFNSEKWDLELIFQVKVIFLLYQVAVTELSNFSMSLTFKKEVNDGIYPDEAGRKIK